MSVVSQIDEILIGFQWMISQVSFGGPISNLHHELEATSTKLKKVPLLVVYFHPRTLQVFDISHFQAENEIQTTESQQKNIREEQLKAYHPMGCSPIIFNFQSQRCSPKKFSASRTGCCSCCFLEVELLLLWVQRMLPNGRFLLKKISETKKSHGETQQKSNNFWKEQNQHILISWK